MDQTIGDKDNCNKMTVVKINGQLTGWYVECLTGVTNLFGALFHRQILDVSQREDIHCCYHNHWLVLYSIELNDKYLNKTLLQCLYCCSQLYWRWLWWQTLTLDDDWRLRTTTTRLWIQVWVTPHWVSLQSDVRHVVYWEGLLKRTSLCSLHA